MCLSCRRTLAKALTEIVIRLDLSNDDAIAPEAAMEVLDPVTPSCRTCPSRTGEASPI
jgi:hypothetical protein